MHELHFAEGVSPADGAEALPALVQVVCCEFVGKGRVAQGFGKGLGGLAYAKGDASKARKMSVTVAELPQYHDKEIKRIREDLNLTQKNFAFVLGVSPKTVEAWESGRNTPQGTAL